VSVKRSSVRTMQAALLAGVVLASGSALAQQTSDVVVEAARPAVVMRNGPNEVLSVTRHISYSDLDLATQKGDRELEKRINYAATAVCKRLDTLQPAEKPADLMCVKKTIAGAMVQARAAISAASEAAAR